MTYKDKQIASRKEMFEVIKTNLQTGIGLILFSVKLLFQLHRYK